MKTFLALLTLAVCVQGTAQNVGINTNTPSSTLQVVGAPVNAAVADGITIPSLTGDQLQAKDATYSTAQSGTLVYITSAVTSPSGKTEYVSSPGFYYFDGTAWRQTATRSGSGQLLNSVFVDDPTLLISSTNSNSNVDVISYDYNPVSNNSKIMVQYHNSNYTISGTTGGSSDQFTSQLFFNSSSSTTNTQRMETQGSANSAFRTGTVFPIAGVSTNSSTATITIKVQLRRSSGDDTFTFNGSNGTLIIQEISN